MSDSGVDDGGESSLDAMRRLLEGSWNEEIMGVIPDSPEAAANEAGGCMVSARDRGQSLMMVNLLLPSYDITQGPSFYDEVEAVSFCVALSRFLESKACIVVRDNKTKNTVTRVLEAREAAAQSGVVEEMDDDDVVEIDDDEKDDDSMTTDVTSDESSTEDNGDEEDIGEFGSKGDTRTGNSKKSELSDFRKQLMADWDAEDDDSDETAPSKPSKKKSMAKSTTQSQPAVSAEKQYRLTSMFGDAKFTAGPDMFDKVIQAVSVNGQPKEDEDTLIILSAASEEETIGVRALASKFQKTKTIVLVNCQFEVVPVEISKAETVYSLLPLAAKPKGNGSSDSVKLPKVVVLRRFPRDFEVFMDFGKGFELTESVSTSRVGKRGPSLQWIAERLKKQMDARY